MQRNEATQLTRALLDQHSLQDWKIRLVTDLTRPFLGKCVYTEKCIYLNAHHIDTHPDVEIHNTIRHEIAHALTPGHQHDEIWQEKAHEIRCDNVAPCASYGFDARAIDAIRSGHVVEVSFDEQIVRTPKYKITQLKDTCPTCGKIAKEKHRIEINGKIIIFLECGHVTSKVAESFSPFESITFDGDSNCKHEWNNTTCAKCGAHKLYPFQVEGARYLEKANGRAGVFDEMGLGKTIQALAWLKFHSEALPTLFIVKSGIKYQWSKEVTRVLGMLHLAQVIQTSNDALIPGLKCYIISYDMLVPKIRTNKNGKTITSGFDINKFKERGIKTVILDECQQIKNPDSTRTQMVRRIVRDVGHVIPLSGTPWKNRGSEFFPVLNMLDPIRFNSYNGFLNRWVEYYYDGARQKMGGIANPARFKEYTSDILIRRERAEVMKELPIVSRNAYYCQMDEDSSKAYNTEVNDFVKFWNTAVIGGDEDSFESQQGVLARLTKMRHLTGLSKIPNTIEFAKEFLEDTDRKLVIFVHHKDVGEIIYDQLSKHCIEERIAQPLRLTADLSSEERFLVQEKFNSPNYRIMVASTLASGEGLNLQSCADCIVHERQWNPANEEQAEGRFIRIGQQSNAVIATYMLAQGSIDDHFHSLVEAKRARFHAAMNNGKMNTWNEAGLVRELAQKIVDSARR
jgi:SNF2 family DNA or RNA helicase